MDTGMGLPESELPKLFDKFYRVPNSVKVVLAGLS